MKAFIPVLAVSLATCLLATPVFAIPYCSSTEQVNCAKYGIGGKDCRQTDSDGRTQCVDVSQRGLDIIHRQERRDRDRDDSQFQERCPAGFQQSEQKCSSEERRRGCKDVRLNNGIGCVKR